MPSPFDVIVVGSYSVDLIFTGMSEFIQPGKDILATDFNMTPGETFISVTCMHRLGIKVGWAGDFGNDDFSKFALQLIEDEGLDKSLFVVHNRSYRRISVAASYPQERGFLTYYDPDPAIPAGVNGLMKSQAKVVFIPALYFGEFFNIGRKIIRTKKMKIIMDGNSSQGEVVGSSKISKSIRSAIQSCDIFLPNAVEARRLTRETDLRVAIRILGELCPTVVIKDGSNGSYGLADSQVIHVPTISVVARDTTGAGDNFDAGFIRAWLNGEPLETCMKWGNIVGSLSTTELGGTTRKITIDDVNKYLR